MKYIVLLGLVFFSFLSFENQADNKKKYTDEDHNGKGAVLQASLLLTKILPKYCIFYGSFEQKRDIIGLVAPLYSSGKLFFSCKKGLIWHSEIPFTESLIYTSKNLHFRNSESTDLEILNGPQHHYLAQLLIGLLSTDIQLVADNFTIAGEEGKEFTRITLKPIGTSIKMGLDNIILEKLRDTSNDDLTIYITDTHQQKIQIKIRGITYFVNTKKTDVSKVCSSTSVSKKTNCNILLTPEHFQETNPTN